MATETREPLGSFADWVRSTDPHAPAHLPLLERAGRILGAEGEAPRDERRALAAELEGWRYQHLDQRMGRLARRDRELADALDLAANELSGRKPRAPRAGHLVIHDLTPLAGPIAEAGATLDPDVDLEELASRARRLTQERFAARGASEGTAAKRRMLLYAPLYVSSYCTNHCTYCGFRHPNPIERRHLSPEEALDEAAILRGRGFRHILLVGGDEPRLTTPEYYAAILRTLVARGIDPAIEIAPQPTDAYAEMVVAGACGITLYQETYNEEFYALYHPRGTKASFHWRLEGVERAAEGGIGRLGLGILLGLADPREDLLAMIRHARYLHDRFPDRRLAFSLPRIYEAPKGFQTPYPVDDEAFVRMYCALRIAFPDAELVLSTREPAALRNRLAQICITQMSAGSRTVPGGYEEAAENHCGQQFPVSDHRTPAEVATWLEEAGFQPEWGIPH
jgi:2-iminoacetate synthase